MRCIVTVAAWLVLGAGAAAQVPAPSPPPAPAPVEPAVTWGGEVDVVSQYVWRGLRYSEGMVVWPTGSVSARGFTAAVFLNYDRQWDPNWNEYDLTFSYTRTVGRWTLTGTYTRYVYYLADQKDATSELIGRAACAVGPGAIFTTHAFDVEQYKGSYYLEAGYAVEHDLDPKSTISADASIAFWRTFIDRYTRKSATHITDGLIGPLTLNVSYLRKLAPRLAIRPHVSFIYIGDSKARHLLDPHGATAGFAIVVGG